MNKNFISKGFLIFLILAIIYACYLVFRPFLVDFIVAIILVSIFYTPYEWLSKKLGERRSLAALLMCIIIVLVIIVPMINLIVLGAQKVVETYNDYSNVITSYDIDVLENTLKEGFLRNIPFVNTEEVDLKEMALNTIKIISSWFYNNITGIVGSLAGLFWTLIAMYFFFIDGKFLLEKLMYLTPLPNKYDKEIFKKFKDVSTSIIVSTFLTAIVQGVIGGIGFLIVGLPAFFAGVLMGVFSLVPYIGTSIVWFPTAVYLLAAGKLWQGIFMFIWGAVAVGMSDNLIRTYLIKGKAQAHPMFVFFSILGGLTLFGFWGLAFGPLILSLAITIFHIYEMEYENLLEK